MSNRESVGLSAGVAGTMRLVPVAIVITALACGAAAAQPAAWEAELTASIPKAMEKASVPGAIIGIWQEGADPYIRAFGLRDTATGEPMTADLHMRVGSVTKTFATTAILQLFDQGKLGLDDPISKYVPGVPNGDAITLRMLAGMRSGLFDYSEVTKPETIADPQRKYTPQDMIRIASNHPPVLPPNQQFDYNNTNTVLLGLVVEKASGQPLARYLEANIWKPLGLGHTSLPDDGRLASPFARGYAAVAEGKLADVTDWNPSWGWAAGGMVSTVDDMATWAQALITGKLVSPAARIEREKFQPAPSEGDGSLYGFGIEYQNGWMGHNGNIFGYQTYVYYEPTEKTTMVVLVNSSVDAVGVWHFIRGIVGMITPDHPWPPPPKGE